MSWVFRGNGLLNRPINLTSPPTRWLLGTLILMDTPESFLRFPPKAIRPGPEKIKRSPEVSLLYSPLWS